MWSNYCSFSFTMSPTSEYSQGWFPLGLMGLISLLSKGLSRVFPEPQSKSMFFSARPSLRPAFTSVCAYWKTIALTIRTSVGTVFLIHCWGLSQLFFQGERSFNSMAAVTIPSNFGAQEKKICHCFTFSHFFFFCHKVLGLEFMTVIFFRCLQCRYRPQLFS